jgi:hypothetical protein
MPTRRTLAVSAVLGVIWLAAATGPPVAGAEAATNPVVGAFAGGVASPPFEARTLPIPPRLERRLRGTTWHPGCPVPISGLRLLRLPYWGFDGRVHRGPMVVNASVASDVVSVFRTLFAARFPIERIALARKFRPNADPNTKHDLTAAFNCRPVITPAGPQPLLSMHAYGLAIDVNPLRNPYVSADGFVRNRYARPYADRSKDLPGMIHPGDVVVRAFERIGWIWGGTWTGGRDYMHFSANGR